MDDLVWHYTTVQALIQIVSSGILRASDCNFLNDSREATLANALFQQALDTDADPADGNIRNAFNALTGKVVQLYPEDARWFVLCADATDDHLNGWMNYSRGDTLGCAIGLDSTSPLHLADAQYSATEITQWTPVEYSQDGHQTIASESLARLRLEVLTDVDPVGAAYQLTGGAVNEIRSRVKDGYFKDECEHRVTVHFTPRKAIKFLAAPTGIRPYVEITGENSRLPICMVRLAPGATLAAVESTRLLLDSNGYETSSHAGRPGYSGIPVELSRCPYRP